MDTVIQYDHRRQVIPSAYNYSTNLQGSIVEESGQLFGKYPYAYSQGDARQLGQDIFVEVNNNNNNSIMT